MNIFQCTDFCFYFAVIVFFFLCAALTVRFLTRRFISEYGDIGESSVCSVRGTSVFTCSDWSKSLFSVSTMNIYSRFHFISCSFRVSLQPSRQNWWAGDLLQHLGLSVRTGRSPPGCTSHTQAYFQLSKMWSFILKHLFGSQIVAEQTDLKNIINVSAADGAGTTWLCWRGVGRIHQYPWWLKGILNLR